MINTKLLEKGILKEFSAKLQKQGKFKPFLDQFTINELIQTMSIYLNSPQFLYQRLRSNFFKTENDQEVNIMKEEVPPSDYLNILDRDPGKRQVIESDSSEDELAEFQDANIQKVKEKNDSKTYKDTENKIELNYKEEDSYSQQYEQECKLIQKIKSNVMTSSPIHISGIYNQSTKKYNSKREQTKIKIPFSLIKNIREGTEHLILDIDCQFTNGSYSNLYKMIGQCKIEVQLKNGQIQKQE